MTNKRKSPQDKLRTKFSKFSALINEIAEMEELSPKFVEEIEFATNCMGMILFMHDEKFKKIAEEAQATNEKDAMFKLAEQAQDLKLGYDLKEEITKSLKKKHDKNEKAGE